MNEEFLRKLRISHAALTAILQELQGVGRQYEKASPALRHLEAQILSHFMLLNNDLFQALNEFYAGNRESLKILEFLSHDLKELKIKMLTFFEQHSGEPGSRAHGMFSVQLGEFSRDILTRIEVEEKYLVSLVEGLSI